MPKLKVYQNRFGGQFECIERGACGSPIVGRGASVVEAVGDWAIYSSTVEIVCDPPELLQKFKMGHIAAPSRED